MSQGKGIEQHCDRSWNKFTPFKGFTVNCVFCRKSFGIPLLQNLTFNGVTYILCKLSQAFSQTAVPYRYFRIRVYNAMVIVFGPEITLLGRRPQTIALVAHSRNLTYESYLFLFNNVFINLLKYLNHICDVSTPYFFNFKNKTQKYF